MRGPSFHPALVLTPPWASREGEGSQGGHLQGRVCLCACATGSWLVLELHLFLGVCTEPSPAVAQQLCRTSAPICVVSLHPHVPPLPCSAVFSHPKPALGALDLPRIVPAAQGWARVSSTEERLGGWWESSVPWQGSPAPQSLSCTGRTLTPHRGRWWRRGRSVPWQLRVPCHSAGRSVPPGSCVVAAGGCPAGLCVRDAPGWQ